MNDVVASRGYQASQTAQKPDLRNPQRLEINVRAEFASHGRIWSNRIALAADIHGAFCARDLAEHREEPPLDAAPVERGYDVEDFQHKSNGCLQRFQCWFHVAASILAL